MKKRDYIMGIVMLCITAGFSLSGGFFYSLRSLADKASELSALWGLAAVLLKCIFFAAVLVAIDIVRRGFKTDILRTYSAILFCAVPIIVLQVLFYSGVFNNGIPAGVAPLLFSLMQWGDYAYIFVVVILVWTLYQSISDLVKARNSP